MPLVRKIELENGFIALWQLDEEDDNLLSKLEFTGAEEHYLCQLTHSRRRREWLTWHFMARFFLGEDVQTGYNERGAPVLTNHEGFIGVSHSKEYVALYYNSEPCAIDIESVDRDYGVARRRILSQTELGLANIADDRFLALAWCAKEVAYKYAKAEGVDILRDLVLSEIDYEKSEIKVELFGSNEITLRYDFFDHHCMAYTKE